MLQLCLPRVPIIPKQESPLPCLGKDPRINVMAIYALPVQDLILGLMQLALQNEIGSQPTSHDSK